MPEAGLRYPIKDGLFSSHAQVLALVGPGSGRRLLDVGCAQGNMAASFQDAGWNVLGVEPNPGDADAARQKGLTIVEGGLEAAMDQLDGGFDCVVVADVLEHMANPEASLCSLAGLLRPQGRIVASIPNIAHVAVRAQLLAGSFNYTDRGPLDRTHLRFFTRRTVQELFRGSGLTIESIGVTPAPLEVLAPRMGIRAVPRSVQVANHWTARVWPGGLAYQFLIVAFVPLGVGHG